MAVLPVPRLAAVGDVGTSGMLISWVTAPRFPRLDFLLGSTLARRTLTCKKTPRLVVLDSLIDASRQRGIASNHASTTIDASLSDRFYLGGPGGSTA